MGKLYETEIWIVYGKNDDEEYETRYNEKNEKDAFNWATSYNIYRLIRGYRNTYPGKICSCIYSYNKGAKRCKEVIYADTTYFFMDDKENITIGFSEKDIWKKYIKWYEKGINSELFYNPEV